MKYVTGYLNYPKNLFFKIKLQKQYKMDRYNLLYFYLARNQKIYNTLWKKQMNSYATRQLYVRLVKSDLFGIYSILYISINFETFTDQRFSISQCSITRNWKSFCSYVDHALNSFNSFKRRFRPWNYETLSVFCIYDPSAQTICKGCVTATPRIDRAWHHRLAAKEVNFGFTGSDLFSSNCFHFHRKSRGQVSRAALDPF